MSGFRLRSVNLRDDVGAPERLSHYQPTRRSAPVIRAVLQGGATMVMAAYGSGKSLAAGVGALSVINKDKDLLRSLAERLKPVEPDLSLALARRLEQRACGRVVVLNGQVRDLPGALADAFELPRKRGIDAVLGALEGLAETDHVAVVWDEFGRHLEGIVNEGRTRELDAVQRLAEWAVRARRPSASLTLLLHQNLLAYATALNQTSRNEWRKVEGRFEQLRFVEDSQELYELAATVVSEQRPEGVVPPRGDVLRALASRVAEAGWFDGMQDLDRLAGLLARAYPVSAAALQVLPRLVARVGQNERSLFAFLSTADLSRPIGMEEVYASFSDAMRSDVGIGGFHRRWVETETARSRAAGDAEREALAAACLLQLGVDGERKRLTRATLETAVASRGVRAEEAAAAVDALVARKLLLHRKLNDDVSIWHGADLDLATRIREERARRMEGFELVEFLDRQHPAPFIRPIRHNLVHGTARYLSGRYVRAADVALGEGRLHEAQPLSEWGHIFFVLADSAEELARARRRVEAGWPGWERTLVVLPAEPINVFEAALEVDALLALQRDDSLLAEDPLVGQELAELLAVARRQLAVVLHRLTTDRPSTAEWWYAGARVKVDRDRSAGIAASDLMDRWYGATPTIRNDQVMRNRLSRQMETARVRVLTRILERAQDARLGYRDEELSSAESTVYRTVLEATGLHRLKDDAGCFATPEDIADPGLRHAWSLAADFFQAPGTRTLADLVAGLSAPPVGLPSGVLPILVVAGYKAFGRAVSLRTDGVYAPDLLGFDASRLFLEPGRITVEVHPNDADAAHYLGEVAYVFDHRRAGPLDERVRFAADALAAWRATLSEGVRRSKRHTDDGRLLLRLLADAEDSPRLILQQLPEAFGQRHPRLGCHQSTLRVVEKARNDIDRLVEGYAREAVEVVGEILSLKPTVDPVRGVQSWVACLDVLALMRRDDVTMTDKAILRTALDTSNGRYSAESLARTVSSVLLHRGIEKWEDGTANQLRRALRECRARVEDAALADPASGEALEPVILARISALEAKLERIRSEAAPQRVAAGGTR